MNEIVQNDINTTIKDLRNKIQDFSDARGWDNDQNPKNLAMALIVETAELVEIFQWVHSDNTNSIKDDPKKFEHLKEEIADVFWYLTRICNHYDIDLSDAVSDKAIKNGIKYPV